MFGVASLSAPCPASLGLLSTFGFGILATGLRRVLAADRVALRISFTWPPLIVVDRGPYAMRLTPAAFTKGQHRSGSGPLRWESAGTSISDAGCTTTLHRRYSRRSAIKQCAVIRRYQSLFVIPAGRRRGCSGRGLPCLEEPTPVRLRSG